MVRPDAGELPVTRDKTWPGLSAPYVSTNGLQLVGPLCGYASSVAMLQVNPLRPYKPPASYLPFNYE